MAFFVLLPLKKMFFHLYIPFFHKVCMYTVRSKMYCLVLLCKSRQFILIGTVYSHSKLFSKKFLAFPLDITPMLTFPLWIVSAIDDVNISLLYNCKKLLTSLCHLAFVSSENFGSWDSSNLNHFWKDQQSESRTAYHH